MHDSISVILSFAATLFVLHLCPNFFKYYYYYYSCNEFAFRISYQQLCLPIYVKIDLGSGVSSPGNCLHCHLVNCHQEIHEGHFSLPMRPFLLIVVVSQHFGFGLPNLNFLRKTYSHEHFFRNTTPWITTQFEFPEKRHILMNTLHFSNRLTVHVSVLHLFWKPSAIILVLSVSIWAVVRHTGACTNILWLMRVRMRVILLKIYPTQLLTIPFWPVHR